MPPPDGTHASLFLRLNSETATTRELAWDEFFHSYHPTITRFAHQHGATHAQAEDVAQEVMLGFFNTSAKFEYAPEKGRFRGYLKACVCRVLGRQRNKNREQFVADDQLNAAADADRVWDELWEQRIMELAVAALEHQESAQSCDIFRRCVLDGTAPKSVAESLGMTIDAVYKSRQRSMAAFRNILANLTADELYC